MAAQIRTLGSNLQTTASRPTWPPLREGEASAEGVLDGEAAREPKRLHGEVGLRRDRGSLLGEREALGMLLAVPLHHDWLRGVDRVYNHQ